MGINFLKLPEGYFEVRYLGGVDYQKKYSYIKEVIDYIITYTVQVLQTNTSFSDNDLKILKNMLSPIIAFASSQIFATTIKMLFNPTEIIVSSTSDRGNIEDTIECLGNAENREIAFNGNILFDIINHLSDDNIKFIFDDEISKPIKVVNNEGNIVDIIIPLQSR